MVLPYITVSIIASLGSLRPSELRTLGLRAAAVIGGLWLVALVVRVPDPADVSLDSERLVLQLEPRRAAAGVRLRRPLHSGEPVQLPGEQRRAGRGAVLASSWASRWSASNARERLLDVLQVARDAISAATRFVTRLTPYGLFAIAANAAGTLGLEQLSRLQIYLVAYVAVALLVSLWVLPGLVAALTPIRARDILGESRDSLHHRVHRRRPVHRAAGPHAGQPHAARPARSRRRRAGPADGGHRAGLLQLPAHREAALAELRALRGMVRRRAGAAVGLSAAGARRARELLRQPQRGGAVSARPVPDSGRYVPAVSRDRRHQLARRIAGGGGAHADGGAARRLRRHRPPSLAARTAPVVRRHHRGARRSLVIGGTRVLFATGLSQEYSKDKVLASMHLLHEPVEATVARTPSPAPATSLPPLETIEARKVLRVGYLPDALPFAFFNQARRPGGLRRRARAPPGARDGRQPGVRARRSRHGWRSSSRRGTATS